jgi:hypothetical protein
MSPTISISESTPSSYVLQVTDRNGSYLTPNLRSAGTVNSANLSTAGSSMSTQVGNLIYTVNNANNGAVSVQLSAASGTVLADVKKNAQFDAAGMDSASWDNTTFTTTPVTIDAQVFGRSNEYHITRIRQQDPATGLWNICDVNLFVSASGGRTNVWTDCKASGLTI